MSKRSSEAQRLLTKPIRQSALWQCVAAVNADAGPAVLSFPKPSLVAPGEGYGPGLLVEDSPVNLEVAVAISESVGCVVETGLNDRPAFERYASGDYGLIFMDCQMPEMNGFEAIVEIRRRERSVEIVRRS